MTYHDAIIVMTEKQIQGAIAKIDKYKKALAADKRYWGGQYRDSQGTRYQIPALYIKIGDFQGGLKYLNWFSKHFPDDSGYPIFLFEWTIILFKCGKLVEAEQKAHHTYFANTYLFEKFLGKTSSQPDKDESSNWEQASLADKLPYSREDEAFSDFAVWVEAILQNSLFLDKANEFMLIAIKLKTEPVGPERSKLVNRLYEIKYG